MAPSTQSSSAEPAQAAPACGGRPARRAGCLFWAVVIWIGLLGASHAVRRLAPAEGPPARGASIEAWAIEGQRQLDRPIRLHYLDVGPAFPAGGAHQAPSTVVLLHGSPGSAEDFATMLPVLAERRRVVVPDLPGFGASTHDVPDYSIAAHARYALQLLEALDVESAHVVGFSMGGGVALSLCDLAPERVGSLTLLSSIGVQELELFGDHRINRTIHGAQLTALWFVREAVPQFGWLDRSFFGMPYARNFYDSDQRPLRGILDRLELPTLILHGDADLLVPPSAAIEHRRIVPQSELQMLPTGHFMVFAEGPTTASRVDEFLARVEHGAALRRADATAERRAAAARPFDPAEVPPYTGFALLIMGALIVLSSFVSEDLACIAAGLLVAHGRMEFAPALAAAFAGVLVGDVLLFLAGRWIGRPALRRAPLRWFIHEEHVEIASRWLDRRGPIVIGVSRFLPGARLPTYFTAGMLHTDLVAFGFYFFIAVALWTPALVGLSVLVGEHAFAYSDLFRAHWLGAVTVLGVTTLFVVHIVVPSFTFHGRRKLVGRWGRIRHSEFWPPWAFYPPVLAYALWLGVRHRGLLVCTAANPAIEAGGFIAESKAAILRGLAGAAESVARTHLIPVAENAEQRIADAQRFMADSGLELPVVLKPDAGQRGSGVVVARTEEQLRSYLRTTEFDTLVQEYVPGHELGIFYYRLPGEPRGRIFSVTDKRVPYVTGDGRRTLEHLILADRRAVIVAEHYLTAQAHQLFRVPAEGERVALVELGTHCRGAIFLDGRRLWSEALERRIDEISRGFAGFWFGRFDVRAPDLEELRAGRGFKIIELNGVTSEATHIYDPSIGLFRAWGVLFEQWRLAYEIGARNRARGAPSATVGELLRLVRRYRQISRTHPG